MLIKTSRYLHILHGFYSLPSAEAIKTLRPFVSMMHNRAPGNDRLADASATAVGALMQGLEAEDIATDDLWQGVIEALPSLTQLTGASSSRRFSARACHARRRSTTNCAREFSRCS